MSIRDWILGDGRADIVRVARGHGVERIALFGSVARGDDREDSDCDFMVDFSGPASLVDLAVLKDGLEELLGRDVDVVRRCGADRRAPRETPVRRRRRDCAVTLPDRRQAGIATGASRR